MRVQEENIKMQPDFLAHLDKRLDKIETKIDSCIEQGKINQTDIAWITSINKTLVTAIISLACVVAGALIRLLF